MTKLKDRFFYFFSESGEPFAFEAGETSHGKPITVGLLRAGVYTRVWFLYEGHLTCRHEGSERLLSRRTKRVTSALADPLGIVLESLTDAQLAALAALP